MAVTLKFVGGYLSVLNSARFLPVDENSTYLSISRVKWPSEDPCNQHDSKGS